MQSVVIFPFLCEKKKKVESILLNDYCTLDMQSKKKKKKRKRKNILYYPKKEYMYIHFYLFKYVLNTSCISKYI